MRFLDFQLARVHSAAFDLAYFIHLSAPKRVLDEVDKYLRIYYNSLSDFLKELGSDPDSVFPFDVFMMQWKKYRKFGLAMGLVGFRFMLTEQDEVPELTTKEILEQSLVRDIANQKEQDRRVIDMVRYFVETGGV